MIDASYSEPCRMVTLHDIRKAHSELMQATLARGDLKRLVPRVDAFVREVADLGSALSSQDERATAQNIINYWSVSLVGVVEPDSPSLARVQLKPFSQSHDESSVSADNPFRDLAGLGRDDDTRLSGREDAIRALLEKMGAHAIVFVTGPVGSGRSSLVTAGVLPQIANTASDQPATFTLFSPGPNPLEALAAIVKGSDAASLRRKPEQFRQMVEAVCGERPALLIVDNCEELFTRCIDQQMREIFGRAIASLAADPRRHSTILIVRDEWVDQVSHLKAIKAYAIADARFSPAPPTAAEIRRILVTAARGARLQIASGVVDDLSRELQGDKSALSLLQFMLLHLWPLRKGNRIGWRDYRDLGRPNDAVASIAEKVFLALPEAAQGTAQRLFLALVKPGTEGSAYSVRESRQFLERGGSDTAMIEAVAAFEDAGLLKVSPHIGGMDDGLQIINDSLMYRWPRLVEWLLEEHRKFERRLQFVATARLWQKTGHALGLLLTDKAAVEEARSYSDTAPEIRDLVAASDKYLRKIKTRGRIAIGAVLAIALVALVFIVVDYMWYYQIPSKTIQTVNTIRKQSIIYKLAKISNDAKHKDIYNKRQRDNFEKISQYQKYSSVDIDLSAIDFNDVDLSGLSLHNLQFLRAGLTNVTFGNGAREIAVNDIKNAKFYESHIQGSRFIGSDLTFAQFRNADIEKSYFKEAKLYRAAFDDARLSDVDFEGADLRLTTFWNTSFDRNFATHFKGTAWWLAVGWTPDQITELLKQPIDRNNIVNIPGFSEAIGLAKEKIRLSAGRFDRAIALNVLAWTLAIYGVDLLPVGKSTSVDNFFKGKSKAVSEEQCGDKTKPPDNALGAAIEAHCLINVPGKREEKYTTYAAILEDTLGYILLQSGETNRAAIHLANALRLGASTQNPDTRFRYAVAEFASGRPADAERDMTSSIEKGYIPTHERVRLMKYLLGTPLGARLDAFLAKAHPPRFAPDLRVR